MHLVCNALRGENGAVSTTVEFKVVGESVTLWRVLEIEAHLRRLFDASSFVVQDANKVEIVARHGERGIEQVLRLPIEAHGISIDEAGEELKMLGFSDLQPNLLT